MSAPNSASVGIELDHPGHALGYRPFADLADTLLAAGFAVLRLDDRGVGASTGRFDGATTEDFARDA